MSVEETVEKLEAELKEMKESQTAKDQEIERLNGEVKKLDGIRGSHGNKFDDLNKQLESLKADRAAEKQELEGLKKSIDEASKGTVTDGQTPPEAAKSLRDQATEIEKSLTKEERDEANALLDAIEQSDDAEEQKLYADLNNEKSEVADAARIALLSKVRKSASPERRWRLGNEKPAASAESTEAIVARLMKKHRGTGIAADERGGGFTKTEIKAPTTSKKLL